ncbi:MAG: hypothetical protein GXP28_05665 [Planctomycetes bacterium]|nr:hypothetical protein [Planctomycetota bacterium]
MRVLLSGVIGAAAAAAAWMAIEHSTKQEIGWMAIVVGLVTGLAVHKAAGAGSRASFARGALAAVLALIVCVVCRQVYAKVMQTSDPSAVTVAAADPAESRKTETGEAESEETDSEQATEPTKPVLSLGKQAISEATDYGSLSFEKGLTQWDMLWLSMAALTAYVVGKGRDQVVASDAAAEESPDKPA